MFEDIIREKDKKVFECPSCGMIFDDEVETCPVCYAKIPHWKFNLNKEKEIGKYRPTNYFVEINNKPFEFIEWSVIIDKEKDVMFEDIVNEVKFDQEIDNSIERLMDKWNETEPTSQKFCVCDETKRYQKRIDDLTQKNVELELAHRNLDDQLDKLGRYLINDWSHRIKEGGAVDLAIELLKEYKWQSAPKEEPDEKPDDIPVPDEEDIIIQQPAFSEVDLSEVIQPVHDHQPTLDEIKDAISLFLEYFIFEKADRITCEHMAQGITDYLNFWGYDSDICVTPVYREDRPTYIWVNISILNGGPDWEFKVGY